MKAQSVYRKISPLLRPLGASYALLMRQRRALYAKGSLPSYTPPCPCVSIGNIAWGGTGKTPFTVWLLEWARRRSLRAVTLTRGYGGKPGKGPLLVRPGCAPARSGDEPLMLACAFPEAFVLTFPQRTVSARLAEKTLAPDIMVLDDGMQHLALRRDTDIVLLRPQDLDRDWNRVIPSGPWREGVTALSAASVFAVKADAAAFADLAPLACRRLEHLGRPVFSFSLAPLGLRALFPPARAQAGQEEEALPPLLSKEQYHNRPYALVSGVGNPSDVERTAELVMGRPPVQHFAFDDHHPFSSQDVQAVLRLSASLLPVVCTAKDAVKLRAFQADFGITPAWVMETELQFGSALFTDCDFPTWWEQTWQHFGQNASGKGT